MPFSIKRYHPISIEEPIELTPLELARAASYYINNDGYFELKEDFINHMYNYVYNEVTTDNMSEQTLEKVREIIYDVVVDRANNTCIIEEYINGEGATMTYLSKKHLILDEVVDTLRKEVTP